MPSCPVCHSDSTTLLGEVSSAEAAQHFVLREADPERYLALDALIARLWRATRCELRRCGACGFGFAWPYVAGDGRFYNLAYPSVGYPSAKWEYARTLEALRPLATQDMMALEIGSGFGLFLDKICPRFVKPGNVVAVEYNETSRAALARKGYQAMAVDVRHAEFLRFRSRFNLIFMFQVLEHMDELDALMERLKFLAAPDCHIFIGVPNSRRIAFNEQNGGLLDMPPNHIGRWTPRALEIIAQRLGLVMTASEVEPVELATFVKGDLYFAYLRRAQVAGSIANQVRSLPRNRARTLLEMAVIAASAPSRLTAWWAGYRQVHELGDTLWVHLRHAEDRTNAATPASRDAAERAAARDNCDATAEAGDARAFSPNLRAAEPDRGRVV
jgi:hypothetical protein